MRSQTASSSGISLETSRNEVPSLRQLADELVDLRLGADVDAACRLVEQEQDDAATSRNLPTTTFCWLPPLRFATRVSTDGVLMLRSWTRPLDDAPLAALVDDAEAIRRTGAATASVAFSVTDRSSTRLCSLRSSATRPRPSRMASCGRCEDAPARPSRQDRCRSGCRADRHRRWPRAAGSGRHP